MGACLALGVDDVGAELEDHFGGALAEQAVLALLLGVLNDRRHALAR